MKLAKKDVFFVGDGNVDFNLLNQYSLSKSEECSYSNQSIKVHSDFQVLTKSNQKISLVPGDSIFMPIKVYAAQNAVSNSTHFVTLSLKSVDGEIIPVQKPGQDTCFLKIAQFKSVRLLMPEKEILLQNGNDSIALPIHLVNDGNTTEQIKVIARMPSIINEGFKELAKVELPPFSDTTVYYLIKGNKALMKKNVTYINVSGLYQDGNIFGLASFNIKTAKSKRSFSAEQRQQSDAKTGYPGSINFMGSYLFSQNEYYQLSVNNALFLSDGSKLNYNIDATYWRNGHQPLLIKNTFLNYESNYFGMTVGNLNRNLDLSISGRGVAFNLNDLKKANVLEVGYVQGGYNLLGDGYSQSNNGTLWGNFSGRYKNMGLNAYLINQQVPYTQSNISLLGANLSISGRRTDSNISRLDLQFGLGNTSDRSGIDKSRQGFSMGMNIKRTLGNMISVAIMYMVALIILVKGGDIYHLMNASASS